MKYVYLDNAATTKVDERVVNAMIPYYNEKYGNASSVHYLGEEARRDIENARALIAKSINAKHKELIFTSGGTESNNLVLKGLFFENKPNGKNHIIVTKIEHDCILNSCKWLETQGAKITYLKVDEKGFIDLNELKKSINEKTLLVSVIHGNNEIGTIQDLEAIGKICKEKEVYFHTDACQSFTKTLIDVKKMNLDFVTLNAHKIHGPKGVGALFIREGTNLTPVFHGGGHEFKLRSGTENVPGIIGFAKSVEISNSKDINKIRELRDYFIRELLKINGVKLNGAGIEQERKGFLKKIDKRLCNNINICIEGIEGEMLGSYLNAKGICTSTGSACSSNTKEKSHVLKAIGLSDEEIASSVRITLSKFTTKEEIDFALDEIKKIIEKLRKF